MTCRRIRNQLPGYLDGALPGREHRGVGEHLESCADCRRELERYRRMSQLMSRMGRASPPPDLRLRIRLAVSQARAAGIGPGRVLRQARLILQNIVQPVALPATGGVATAMLVFVGVFQSLLVGVPLGAVPNDVPINLIQPARLERLAPFPVLHNGEGNARGGSSLLLVEATLDARGEMVDYEILSGPDNPAVRRQLNQVMLFSRFRPQMSFGRPTPGGRVVVIFSEIRVQG